MNPNFPDRLLESHLKEAMAAAEEEGGIAGSVLTYMWNAAASHPRLARLGHAYAIVEAFGKDNALHAGSTRSKTAWSRYRPVAHLWAAWLYFSRPASTRTYRYNHWQPNVDELPALLRIAKQLQDFGEQHPLKHRGEMLLDRDSIWRIDGVRLPSGSIDRPGLSPSTVERVETLAD